MSFRLFSIVIAAALLAPACKAPIPGREEIEADAAWTAGEWTADDGTVWRARINGRRVNATAEAGPGIGRILRGSIQSGVLHYTLQANDGTDLFEAGQATIADATHSLFRDDPAAGDAGAHGLWHINHALTSHGAPAPTVVATPTPTVTAPVAAPSSPPSATPATPSATPTPETPATTTPAAPGVIDLLPSR